VEEQEALPQLVVLVEQVGVEMEALLLLDQQLQLILVVVEVVEVLMVINQHITEEQEEKELLY
jgi:hypothetical protein